MHNGQTPMTLADKKDLNGPSRKLRMLGEEIAYQGGPFHCWMPVVFKHSDSLGFQLTIEIIYSG